MHHFTFTFNLLGTRVCSKSIRSTIKELSNKLMKNVLLVYLVQRCLSENSDADDIKLHFNGLKYE